MSRQKWRSRKRKGDVDGGKDAKEGRKSLEREVDVEARKVILTEGKRRRRKRASRKMRYWPRERIGGRKETKEAWKGREKEGDVEGGMEGSRKRRSRRREDVDGGKTRRRKKNV